MWWALSVAGVLLILLGGLAIRYTNTTKKLGEKEQEVDELKRDLEWYKQALARRNESDPDLDELDRVSASQADAARPDR